MLRKALLFGLAGGVLLAAAPALAQGPTFQQGATSALLSGSNLIVNFQEVGLGTPAFTNIVVTAHVDVYVTCVTDNGGVIGSWRAHEHVTTMVQSAPFQATATGGSIAGSITLATPDPSTLQKCPGDRLNSMIAKITYGNVTVTDKLSGASFAIPGSFTFEASDLHKR